METLEEIQMKELDDLIAKRDKKYIRYWLTQNKVTAKIFARAETFLNLKEWKPNREQSSEIKIAVLEGRVYTGGDILVSRMVAKQIDILLNANLSTEQQIEKVKELQVPYKNNIEIINGLNKHSYWHALHIIMNCFSMPGNIAQKSRSERVKNMTAFNRKKLMEFPMYEVKNYIVESKIKLTSNDRGKWQFFEFINHNRDFDITEN